MTDIKSLAYAFYDAFNVHDESAFLRLLSPYWINNPADPGQANTPAGFIRAVSDMHAAFENFHIKVETIISERQFVVCRIIMRGRHIHDFHGWKASGRQVTFTGMDMHRIEGELIRETWHFENYHGLALKAV